MRKSDTFTSSNLNSAKLRQQVKQVELAAAGRVVDISKSVCEYPVIKYFRTSRQKMKANRENNCKNWLEASISHRFSVFACTSSCCLRRVCVYKHTLTHIYTLYIYIYMSLCVFALNSGRRWLALLPFSKQKKKNKKQAPASLYTWRWADAKLRWWWWWWWWTMIPMPVDLCRCGLHCLPKWWWWWGQSLWSKGREAYTVILHGSTSETDWTVDEGGKGEW